MTEKIIIDIQTNIKDITALKAEINKLREARKENKGLTQEEEKQYAELNHKLKSQNQLLKLNVAIDKEKNGSLKQMQAQLAKAKYQWDRLSKEERENISVGGKLKSSINVLEKEVRQLEMTTGRAGRNVGNYKSAFQGLNSMWMKTMGILAGASGLIRVFGGMLKTTKDFELQMATVRAITKATNEDFLKLKKIALDLGASTKFTASQVGELEVELGKLGFSSKQIIDSSESILLLAEATKSDLGEAAIVAASTIRGFNLQARDSQRVVDVMAASFTNSALDMEKWKTSMANAQVAASVTGHSVEYTAAALGLLVDRGIDASKAGTDLRNILIQLNKQGISLDEAYKMVANSTDKLGLATQLVKQRAAASLIVLAENEKVLNQNTIAYENAAGAAEKMALIMRDTLSGDIDQAKSAQEGFTLSLNEGSGAYSEFARNLVQSWTDILRILTLINEGELTFSETFGKSLLRTLVPITKFFDEYKSIRQILEETKEEEKKFSDFEQKLRGRNAIELEKDLKSAYEARKTYTELGNQQLIDDENRRIEIIKSLQSKSLQSDSEQMFKKAELAKELNQQLIEEEKELTKKQIAELKKRTEEKKKIDKEYYDTLKKANDEELKLKKQKADFEDELLELTLSNYEKEELAINKRFDLLYEKNMEFAESEEDNEELKAERRANELILAEAQWIALRALAEKYSGLILSDEEKKVKEAEKNAKYEEYVKRKLAEAEQDIADSRIKAGQSVLDATKEFAAEGTIVAKAAFLLSKGLAIAEVFIKLKQQLAAIQLTAAELSAISFGVAGPPYAATMSTLARVNAWANVAGIAATAITGFNEGGYTGDGGKYEAAGIVHKGEVVFSQQDVNLMGGKEAVNLLRPTYNGYYDGGIVSENIARRAEQNSTKIQYVRQPVLIVRQLDEVNKDKMNEIKIETN